MASKDISTVDYTDSFNTFFVKDVDDIKQISKDNVKSALGIGVVTGATAEADGTLTLTDSIDKPFELHLYGKSTQDGTPTLDNPIEIVSVENPTLTINNGADLSQTKQLDYVLCGIGDAKDELIIYSDGNGKLIRKTNLIRIEGSNVTLYKRDSNTDTVSFRYQTDGNLVINADSKCNFYARKEGSWNPSNGYQNTFVEISSGSIFFTEKSSEWPTLSDYQNFVDSSGIYVLYLLSTPVTTELTAEQIGIMLNTYTGTTNIFTDQSAGIKAVYTADTKGYIDRKFDELATALVAQTSEQ